MALGTAHAASCYGTQAEAATMLCSTLQGISAAGAVSCVGVSGASSSLGGAASLSLTLRTSSGGTSTDSTVAVPLLECETYGVDYFQPMIGAWVLASIAIVAAKMVYSRIFGTPTHA